MDLSPSNLLTLAGIHATIISIFMAAATGYFVYLVSRRDELLSAVYDEAERVNSITVRLSGFFDNGTYVPEDETNRRELVNRLTRIAMGIPGPDFPPDRKARAKEALRIISGLLNCYPFPQSIEPIPEGGLALGEPTPLEFKDIDEVKKWASEADYLASSFSWLLTAHRAKFLGVLYEATDDLDRLFEHTPDLARLEHLLEPEALEDLRRTTARSTRGIVDTFIHNVETIGQIAHAVKEKVKRWEMYERRTTNRPLILGFLSMNLIAFLAGVVYPITGCRVGLDAIIWVPFIIYGAAFLYLMRQAIART